jgi:hypothetical protein
MKIQIEKTSKYSEQNNVIEFDCKGKGTEDDPLIVDASLNLPESFEINESEVYINITNCTISKLKISVSRNISFIDCYIDWFEISGCTKIRITNTVSGVIGLEMCNDCFLENCDIARTFAIVNSSNNIIRNCSIKERFEYNLFNRCKDNVFENNQISNKLLHKIEENPLSNMDQGKKPLFTIIESPITIECTGKGFKEDPFIFTPQIFYAQRFSLIETVHHVLINNFNLRYIFIGRCKNKYINDCNVKIIELDYASNVKIAKTRIKNLWFGQCKNILISECIIDKVKLKKPFIGGTVFKNCKIDQIKGKSANKIMIENTIINQL